MNEQIQVLRQAEYHDGKRAEEIRRTREERSKVDGM